MNIPEGATTVTAEAGDLKSAIASAAQQLGLLPAQVDYKLDMSHFRSATGVSLARSTVRIVAWGSGRALKVEEPREPKELREPKEPKEPKEPREPKEPKEPKQSTQDEVTEKRPKRSPKAEPPPVEATPAVAADPDPARSKPESLRGAESNATDASTFAQGWFSTLLDRMGVEGTATGTGSPDRVHLSVKAERAGRVVGKRGATLSSIRHILKLAIENRFGPMNDIDVDVGDDRPREDRDSRPERSAAPRERTRDGGRTERDGGRPEREGGRPERDGDRNGRSRPPRRERGDRRDPRGRRDSRAGAQGRYPEEKLRALARRAAEKAIESGQTITINLELNSFDRRIVHVEIGEMEGVESQSEERTGPDGRIVKYVQIIPQRA